MVVCPSCSHENRDSAKFCEACAAPLAGKATTAPREERKVITVLFADLVGFTSRAERLDPEDVQAILSSYHERVRSELERYGGSVEKFIGDAVMAVFGAPVVREDDPERAVRAALAVRESIAELNDQDEARDLHVRIGVTTGEALVRLDARPEKGEGMAAGDVVNTAARLQTAAATDGILVDETTYRATERAIQYRPGPAVDAKGKSVPVAVYEAEHARSSFGVDVRPIGRTPLVGRERELETLVDALARARTEREPQLVTLVGVPGIGKSRLVYELFGRVEEDPELIAWRQGRCLPYGEGVSYWALAEMVKAQTGVLETDSEAEAAAKLGRAVAEVVPDDREADWLERNLRPLLGLEAEMQLTGDRRGEAFAAWRRFLEALADRRPLVLVFEDLHFADDGLLDFVDYIADWATGVPLLLLATARPELLTRRPGWGGGKAHALALSLSPLSNTDTAHLVHALLDQAVLDADLQQQLLERAEGNPLYAEEFARLVAEGRQPDELPETVQGIIAARIDGLAPEEKALLQDAAVVGKVFWLSAVVGLSDLERWRLDELLHALERKEFIRRERGASIESETEYAFRHLLVRDVAYGQIPRAARAGKHRKAAEWLDGLGRVEDHAEMLAHHYLAALDLSRAAGQDVAPFTEPARSALREAGDRALALNAFPAAARYYGEAVSLAPEPDPELLFRRAEALFSVEDDGAESALEDARAALLGAGSRPRAAEADALLADVWWTRGERDGCFEHLSRAEELVRDGPASAAKALVLSQIARFRALAGEVDEPIRIGSEALAIADALGLDELRAHALNNVSIAKGNAGDMENAIADVERSIEIALSVNSPEAARGYNNLSAIVWYAGDLTRGHELRDETMRIAERLGAVSIYRYARSSLTLYLHGVGRWDDAVRLADEIIVECERDPFIGEAIARRVRALIRLARDDRAGALDDARRGLDVARPAKDPQTLLPALAVEVRVNFELGLEEAAGQAGAELVRELALHPSSLNIEWVPIMGHVAAHVGLAEQISAALEPHRGNPWVDAALAVVDERFSGAADRLRAIGDAAKEADARLRAAEQHAGAGRRADAGAEVDLALAFYRSVGATRYIRQGEALLAKTA